ncbi:MAG: glycosyltransferase [Dysgonomonas sp.]|nr:glycosyltransferase [Dysgonomonas sp.]
MNKEPLISVVMPAYDVGEYIELSIKSILNQTLSDFEFIIIDDGSTDNTVDIIKSFNDKRIKLYIQDKNMGLFHTLNYGLNLSSGKYIARMDGDDVSIPERFRMQVDFLEKNKEISILGTSIIRMDNNIRIDYPLDHDSIKVHLLRDPAFAHPTVMMRRADIVSKGLKYGSFVEDYSLWTDAAIAGVKFANLNEVLLEYRVYATQFTSSNITKLEVEAKKIRRKYAMAFSNNRLSEKDLWAIERNYFEVSAIESAFTINKLISLNTQIRFFNPVKLKSFLWENISLKINKNSIIELINRNLPVSFKIWLIKNYLQKAFYNLTQK